MGDEAVDVRELVREEVSRALRREGFGPGPAEEEAKERPLHVKVAEALGWTACHQRHPGGDTWCGWRAGAINLPDDIPRYDTDWAATGPIIADSPLSIVWVGREGDADLYQASHHAYPRVNPRRGHSYLEAACLWLVEFHRVVGKEKAPQP